MVLLDVGAFNGMSSDVTVNGLVKNNRSATNLVITPNDLLNEKVLPFFGTVLSIAIGDPFISVPELGYPVAISSGRWPLWPLLIHY